MTKLDVILAEGDPPARDVAFTMRVLADVARDAARRSLRRRAAQILVWAAAAAAALPAMAALAPGPGADLLLIATGALIAGLGFARLVRRAPA